MKYSCNEDVSVVRMEAGFVNMVLGWRKALSRESTKVENAGFYSRVQEKFLTSLTRFHDCILGEPE